MPSDELLMGWAREKLSLPPLPGPMPPMPPPLPVKPPPTYPHSCIGRCWKSGHCCANMISGCAQPSCYQGCALANVSDDLQSCVSACKAAGGQCTFTYRSVILDMCNQ